MNGCICVSVHVSVYAGDCLSHTLVPELSIARGFDLQASELKRAEPSQEA